jgi:hypothetical protein
VFHELRCSRNQLTKPKSGGLLLLRRNTPLTRRAVAYFYSGAHTQTVLTIHGLVDSLYIKELGKKDAEGF